MKRILIIGAGVTGGYTAYRLYELGAEVSLLARGERAERLEAEGLRLRDGLTGEEQTVHLPILRAPVENPFDLVMICVQEKQKQPLLPLLESVPGRPVCWFLGNTVNGYGQYGDRLGRDRILGGFPDVGGTWDGNVLLYADRENPRDKPFNSLIAGAPFPEAEDTLRKVRNFMNQTGYGVITYHPIMAWHLCHAALILPLAGAYYQRECDLEAAASDRRLLENTVSAVKDGLRMIRKKGYPILPSRLKLLSITPAFLGAAKVERNLRSRFGEVALAGHAAAAREEMKDLAQSLLAKIDGNGRTSFHRMLEGI